MDSYSAIADVPLEALPPLSPFLPYSPSSPSSSHPLDACSASLVTAHSPPHPPSINDLLVVSSLHNQSIFLSSEVPTTISPLTYPLALLANHTTGPLKSSGSPHLPAGMRSRICLARV